MGYCIISQPSAFYSDALGCVISGAQDQAAARAGDRGTFFRGCLSVPRGARGAGRAPGGHAACGTARRCPAGRRGAVAVSWAARGCHWPCDPEACPPPLPRNKARGECSSPGRGLSGGRRHVSSREGQECSRPFPSPWPHTHTHVHTRAGTNAHPSPSWLRGKRAIPF